MYAFRFVFVGVLAASSLPAQSGSLPQGVSLTFERAIPRGGEKRPRYDLRFTYRFEKRSTVWLQGVGVVPASGNLELTLQGDKLVFQARRRGGVLASIPVKPTEVQQTPPTGSPYASTAPGEKWLQDGAAIVAPIPPEQSWNLLAEKLQETYGKYVGPTPCRPDDGGCLLTQWTTLTAPNDILQVQMAVMIVFANAGGKASFKIYYQGRQALIGEKQSWDSTLDEKSRSQVGAKVAVLRAVLARQENSR